MKLEELKNQYKSELVEIDKFRKIQIANSNEYGALDLAEYFLDKFLKELEQINSL